jgi:tRNA pseudouridine55 synthase/H/ACA ribonucleoprotein complex subunit 4
MGLAMGIGAHMQELRRTRSGPFDEGKSHSLHDMRDACSRAMTGDATALHAMIMSVDAAVPDLPNVLIHDRAIDAVCHGAKLAGVGVISCDTFKKDDSVAIVSRNREFVGLGRARTQRAGKKGLKEMMIIPHYKRDSIKKIPDQELRYILLR